MLILFQANLLSTFCTWIDSQCPNLKDLSYNTSGKFWTGTEIIAALQLSDLDEQSIDKCKVILHKITISNFVL